MSTTGSPARPPGDVAIVGIGCFYPGADCPRALWENVLARRQQFRTMPDVRLPLSAYHDPDPDAPDKTYGTQAAVMDGFEFDWVARRIPRSAYEATDIVQWLGLEVALKAIEDAGLTAADLPRLTTGAIVGNTLTGEKSRSETLRLRWPFIEKIVRRAGADSGAPPAFLDGLVGRAEAYLKSVLGDVTEDTLAGSLSNTIAGRICNFLDLKGGGYTVDGACASSLLAVATACEFVSSGAWDLGIAGGVDVSLDAFELIGFAKTGALARSGMHVYDRRANGFIPGEGSGFVVLERLDDARRHGHRIYAVVRGWGISSDGRGAITAPVGAGQAEALRRAYARARIQGADLDLIEGHGTGTAAGDRAEIEGITLALGEAPPRRCGLTSFKSLVGHTKAAAGIGGFIKAVMAVNRRVLPPTAGCQHPNELFESSALSSYPLLRGEVRNPEERLRAGVSGMGFGGINCHVVVESADSPDPRIAPLGDERALMTSAQDSEVFAVRADSWRALLGRFDEVERAARGIALSELTDLAAEVNAQAASTGTGSLRAALVARSPDDLLRLLSQARDAVVRTPPEAGSVARFDACWLGAGPARARIGFLFPGQGSQRLNAARILVERFDWARQRLAQAEETLRELGLAPIGGLMFRRVERAASSAQLREWQRALSQTEVTQPAVCLASALWFEWLSQLGVRPDAVAGHSLGELSAFYAAGAFDFRALIGLAGVRGRAMAAGAASAGTMTSLACGRSQAERLLGEIDGYAVIANVNAPEQIVVSGEVPAIEQLERAAQRANVSTRRLDVSNAFHSRLVAGAADVLRREAPIPERAAVTTAWLYSCTDGRRVHPGRRLSEHFANQLVSTVEFVKLLESMTAAVDLLLEVGPGRVLTGLAAQASTRASCWPVEPEPEQFFDFNRAVAALFTHGVDLRFEELYRGRLVRPFVPASARKFFVNPCERSLPDLGRLENRAAAPSGLSVEGVSDAVLQQYLERRGSFLADVIRADLRSSGALAEGDLPRAPSASLVVVEDETPEPAGDVVEPAQGPLDLLLELVVRRTSFPRETLSGEMRLLDDLNIDSIKAGEIIGEAAQRLGAAGDVDPGALANATLSEVAAALEGARAKESPRGPRLPPSDWVRHFELSFQVEPIERAASDFRGKQIEIVADDGDPLASALAQRLDALGATVSVGSGPDASGAVDGVVMLRPRSSQAAPTDPREVLKRAVRGLHAATRKRQRPVELLAFVQFSGGRFATEGDCVDLDVCATSGFAASVHLEGSAARVRTLDFPPDAALELVVERVVAELGGPEAFVAAGYDATGRRLVPRTVVSPLRKAGDTAAGYVTAKDVVLVTGGARGVTAECALALARKTSARFALVGSTPLERAEGAPPSAAQREVEDTLARFRAESIECAYYACDVTDARAVRDLVQRVERDFGGIDVIVHGAGLNRPARVGSVDFAAALDEVSPKLLGAAHLVEATQGSRVRAFVALGSIIGVSGMPGNAWYAFSNEGLRPILRRFERVDRARSTILMDYGVWSEVGMGTRLGSTERLGKLGIVGIPPREGAERFCDLLLAAERPREVVITSRFVGLSTWRPVELPKATDLRFLEDVAYVEPGVEAVIGCSLSIEKDPYLLDHEYQGSLLFPTVFGLEAMVQLTAYVLGREGFERLVIEDIKLERPIPVDPKTGERIQLQAVVEEDSSSGTRVRVEIRTAKTGFAAAHFSATVVVDAASAEGAEERPGAPKQSSPLPLSPVPDLYGPILFQGPRYQRIRKIHRLWGEPTGSGECVFEAELRPAETESGGRYLLGDPYFRDALLQAGQLMIPRDQGLPVFLKRLEWTRPAPQEAGLKLGYAKLEDRVDQHYFGSVLVYGNDGQVLERMSGHKLRILRHRPELPTASELCDPRQRDAELVRRAMAECARHFGVGEPVWAIDRIPLNGEDRATRHEKLEPLMKAAVRAHDAARGASSAGGEPRFVWDESGKPRLAHDASGAPPGISLSHDGDLCVCVVAPGDLGVDVVSVEPRTAEQWLSLLGRDKFELCRAVAARGASLDDAGAMVWAVAEAAFKALGSHGAIEHESSSEVGARFVARGDTRSCSVVAVPVALTRGPKRVVALARAVSSAERAERPSIPPAVPMHDSVIAGAGPEQQPVLHVPLKLGFAEANGFCGNVHFAQFWTFMGRVREQAIEPLIGELAEALATGRYAWLTNFVEARFYRTVSVGDPLQARFWLERVSGPGESSIAFVFDFRLAGEGGESVALARMQTTWVEVGEHGALRPSPHPPAFAAFVNRQRPGVEAPAEPSWPARADARGEMLWKAPEGPTGSKVLDELTLETGPEDANFVGNVYFSAYARWQGRLLDRFVHAALGRQPKGFELGSRRVRIEHLREALPFDLVLVRMLVSRVFARGVDLRFEYFRLDSNGSKTKLAVSEHEATCRVNGVEAELPAALRRALLGSSQAPALATEA